jgi:murein DD-endopeptidase MepM/ murein hydrolase activator NlpD
MRYVAVDGRYGPLTARGVRTMQRRFGWRPNGVASVGVLARLGISVRRVASVRPTAGVPATGAGRAPAGGRDRYLRSFPVLGGYAYTDTFGAPRSQGSHEGTDIMAARGTALVAVADGRITRLTRTATGLGGIWVWMADAAGTTYYYAHMTTIATGLAPGSPVRAGQLIGTVGNTGDARYGAPHLHFEIHPGGGRAVNPYRHLRAVDPAV